MEIDDRSERIVQQVNQCRHVPSGDQKRPNQDILLARSKEIMTAYEAVTAEQVSALLEHAQDELDCQLWLYAERREANPTMMLKGS